MMHFSFHCKNTPSQREAEIIEKYWNLKEGDFVNTPLGIANEYEITVPQLRSLVREYSWVIVTYAQCMDCGKSMEATVYSQSAFKSFQNSKNILGRRCRACDSARNRKSPNFLYRFTSPVRVYNLEKAVDRKRWSELNDEELDVLKKIVKHKGRGKSHIDQEIFMGNPDDAAIWHIVQCLEQKQLIYVEKSVKWTVEGFDFSRRLEEKLFGTTADAERENTSNT